MSDSAEERRQLNALSDVLAAACASSNASLYDLELRSSTLLVTVERRGGLNLDEVADIARACSEALDEHEEIAPPGRYELEVSSPGLERVLRRPEHFEGAVGETVALRLSVAIDGERRLEGRVTSADAEVVVIEGPSGHKSVPYASIDRAHTVFDWKAALAGSRRADEGEIPVDELDGDESLGHETLRERA